MQTLIRAHNDYQKDEVKQTAAGDKGKLMGTSNVNPPALPSESF